MAKRAIVMGASVAGLCAAGALASEFESVTVLERDPEPEGPRPRKGTPQAWHAHLLLNSGQRALEALFPGFLEDLRESGAVIADAGQDFRWYVSGQWRPVFVAGLALRLQTRPLLESRLRAHVRLAGATIRFGAPIAAPVYADGEVRGVTLESGEVLDAELVVDASGRGSGTPKWLEAWGYTRPGRQAVEVDLAYASGLFEVPDDALPGVDAVLINPRAPDLKRGGAAFRVEGNRWLITLFGYHKDHAPLDFEAFRAWSATIASDEIHQLLAAAKLDGQLRRFTFPRQIRNRYEKLRRAPGRYLVTGDAVCSFDPVFGQGMSVAANEAVVLRDLLRKRGDKFKARDFQTAIARCIDDPWQMATTEAYNWPQTRGWKPAGAKFLQAFTARVHKKAAADPALYGAFLDVVHLDRRPTSLFKPRVLRRVMFGRGRGPESGPDTGAGTGEDPE